MRRRRFAGSRAPARRRAEFVCELEELLVPRKRGPKPWETQNEECPGLIED